MRVSLYFAIFLTVYAGAIIGIRLLRAGKFEIPEVRSVEASTGEREAVIASVQKWLRSFTRPTTPEKLRDQIMNDGRCPKGVRERLAIIPWEPPNIVELCLSVRDIEIGNKKILALLESTPSEEFGKTPGAEPHLPASPASPNLPGKAEGSEVAGEKAKQEYIAGWPLAQWQVSRFFGIEQFISYAILVYGLARLGVQADRLKSVEKDDANLVAELKPEEKAGAPLVGDDATNLVAQLQGLRGKTKANVLREVLEALLNSFDRTRDTGAALNMAQVSLHEGLEPYHFTTERTALFLSLLPTVGFIGTVRGLGEALGFANSSQNLPQVVGGLSIAFDATLVALLCWLALRLRLSKYEHRVVAVTGEIVKTMNGYAERMKSEAALVDRLVVIGDSHLKAIGALQDLSRILGDFIRDLKGGRGDGQDKGN